MTDKTRPVTKRAGQLAKSELASRWPAPPCSSKHGAQKTRERPGLSLAPRDTLSNTSCRASHSILGELKVPQDRGSKLLESPLNTSLPGAVEVPQASQRTPRPAHGTGMRTRLPPVAGFHSTWPQCQTALGFNGVIHLLKTRLRLTTKSLIRPADPRDSKQCQRLAARLSLGLDQVKCTIEAESWRTLWSG